VDTSIIKSIVRLLAEEVKEEWHLSEAIMNHLKAVGQNQKCLAKPKPKSASQVKKCCISKPLSLGWLIISATAPPNQVSCCPT
jgi:hypothetical protein